MKSDLRIWDFIPIVGPISYGIRTWDYFNIENPNISGPALEHGLLLIAYNVAVSLPLITIGAVGLEKLLN